jgi:pimeloyl-ACP methyl ester carboxylesterase
MRFRKYGNSGPLVVVLHGGPAAVGDGAPIAQGLSDSFTAIEPWQRGSGEHPLTVARHIEDLHTFLGELDADSPPALVGHSWGAMLALCYASSHPKHTGPVVLVGCGTFDTASRARMNAILRERTDEHLQKLLVEASASTSDSAELQMKRHKLTRDLSVYDRAEPWHDREEYEPLDMRAHEETWADAMRLQSDGTYPKAFAVITSDVLMLHGDYDPHPGAMIRDSLQTFIPQLEYRELEHCGHSPWLERSARTEFFQTLKTWLTRPAPGRRGPAASS